MLRASLVLLVVVGVALLGSGAQAERVSSPADGPPKVRMSALGAPSKAPPARSLAAAAGEDRRYALANGCYALRPQSADGFVAKAAGGYSASAASVGAAEGFRMQATDLGSYLFYGRGRDFMAAGALDVVAPAGGASPSADWRVDANPDGTFKIALPSSGKALALTAGRLVVTDPANAGAFSFEPADGCAVYPEVDTSASGQPFAGATGWGEVKGMIDLHLHMTAFEFLGGRAHCGRPWHRYGAPYALVDCADHQVGNGCGAVLENALYGNPALPRSGRLAHVQGLTPPRLAHPRADLLQVGRAGVHGRPEGVREPVRGEPGPL